MITLAPFRRELAGDFRRLNLEWIEQLFAVEAADRKVLDDPERSIIAAGGQIYFAMDGANAVGTVAMIRVTPVRYELAKMAVAATHQRRGIGEMLGALGIAWARLTGAEVIFLETNSRLANAIRLYERLGFRHAVDPKPTEYARADVYMELGRTMHKSRLAGFIIDCKTDDLKSAAKFWSAALGLEMQGLGAEEGENYVRLVETDERYHLEVQSVDHESRVHLDIESDDLEAEAQRLEKLGAKRVGRVKGWIVMQAPTGQRFCIVKPQTPGFGKNATTWK